MKWLKDQWLGIRRFWSFLRWTFSKNYQWPFDEPYREHKKTYAKTRLTRHPDDFYEMSCAMSFVELAGDLYVATEICGLERTDKLVRVMLRSGQSIGYTAESAASARKTHKKFKDAWRHAITGVQVDGAMTESDATNEDDE